MEIINGKWEDNYFVINSMERMSNMFQEHVGIRTPETVIKNWHKTFPANNVDGNDPQT